MLQCVKDFRRELIQVSRVVKCVCLCSEWIHEKRRPESRKKVNFCLPFYWYFGGEWPSRGMPSGSSDRIRFGRWNSSDGSSRPGNSPSPTYCKTKMNFVFVPFWIQCWFDGVRYNLYPNMHTLVFFFRFDFILILHITTRVFVCAFFVRLGC